MWEQWEQKQMGKKHGTTTPGKPEARMFTLHDTLGGAPID